MGKLTEKVKDTLATAKDSVTGTDEATDENRAAGSENRAAGSENRAAGSENRAAGSDSLTEYESKEPMTPSKITQHEPTAVKREMTENITESGQVGTNSQDAAERARRSGMTKGTAGASKTESE
jgi:hypothetical protein